MKNTPPEFATWLLERLLPARQGEVLAGDLVEEYGRRCSPAWYWRQVITAIAVSLANQARAEWFAVAYALLWTLFVSAIWGRFMRDPRFQSVVGLGMEWSWPQSLLYFVAVFTAATILTLWVGLSLYLALTHRFERRRLLRGMAVASVLDLAINAGGVFFAGRHRLSIYLISWLPLFFALLISMFLGRGTTSLPSQDSAA